MELGQWIEIAAGRDTTASPIAVALAELLSHDQLQEPGKKLIAKANEQKLEQER